MSDDRSVIAWQAYQASAEKYDYFMLGLASALTAYIGQHLSPVHPGRNAATLEAASLVLLAGAVIGALYQRRAAIVTAGVQTRVLELGSEVGQLRTQLAISGHGSIIEQRSGQVMSGEQAAVRLALAERRHAGAIAERERWSRRASIAYGARDILLVLGVAAYAVAKVWATLSIAPR